MRQRFLPVSPLPRRAEYRAMRHRATAQIRRGRTRCHQADAVSLRTTGRRQIAPTCQSNSRTASTWTDWVVGSVGQPVT